MRERKKRKRDGGDECIHLHSMTEKTLKGDVGDKRFNISCSHNRSLDTHTLPWSERETKLKHITFNTITHKLCKCMRCYIHTIERCLHILQ